MASAHSASELAEFQDGETRLVFARHRQRPDELFYLEDGTAKDQRQWAKATLECFMPVCHDRRLTTVSRTRTGRRDGFTHMRGAGGHSRESQFHLQAKELIARWVRERYPRLEVRTEQATIGRSRIADVMISSLDPPRLLAVEIQYSALDPDEWQARHESYAAQGIQDVWLFGHHGRHLRTDAAHHTVKLTVLHRTILAAGQPLLWINPILGRIGTAAVDATTMCCQPQGCTHSDPAETWLVAPEADSPAVQMAIATLSECSLPHGRFTTPIMSAFRAARDRWQAQCDRDHLETERKSREAQELRDRQQAERREAVRARSIAQDDDESVDTVLTRPIRVATDAPKPRCWRCGGLLTDPLVVSLGSHFDPHCDRSW